MALAAALNHIESNQLATLTNYGEYLEKNPPVMEAQIHEQSAWSCSHGVGRWFRDCGCNGGGRPGWNQRWRAPLRQALDWLRDEITPRFETEAAKLLKDPWAARNDYISLMPDRSDANLAAFFQQHAIQPLSEEQIVTALRLMEMQRHALLMFTSCGWFFDELSGIETVQVIQYAGRALQILENVTGENLEPAFVERLAQAPSNIPEHKNGKVIYEKFVKPAIIDREKLGAHFAVSSLFEQYPEKGHIYSCTFEQQERQLLEAGKARLIIGRSKVIIDVTRASDVLSYAALHFGDHNVNCGVRYFRGEEAFQELVSEFKEAFSRADFPQLIRLMDRHFGESYYSLKNLFRDEQRKILKQVLVSTGQDIESHYRQISDHYTPLMHFLKDINAPMPVSLKTAVDFILNCDLRREFDSAEPNLERVRLLVEQARTGNVELHRETLGYAIAGHLDRRLEALVAAPDNLPALVHAAEFAEVIRFMEIEVNLWKTQNHYFQMRRTVAVDRKGSADAGDPAAQEWLSHFNRLGEHLGFRINA